MEASAGCRFKPPWSGEVQEAEQPLGVASWAFRLLVWNSITY